MIQIDDRPLILFMDDDQAFRLPSQEAAREKGWSATACSTIDGALRTIHNNEDRFIVIFVDLGMQSSLDGLEVVRYVHRYASPRVVACVWTGSDDRQDEARAYEAGAFRVFIKSKHTVDDLLTYIQVGPIQKLFKSVRSQALDDLTGLYNFKTFTALVEAEMKSARDRKNLDVFSLILIDVDNFKALNDKFYYLLGDEVLKEIASVLRTNVRPLDHPCRKSGDEFLIILPGVKHEAAVDVARKLENLVASSSVYDIRSLKNVTFTISCGVGSVQRDEIRDVSSALRLLIERADVFGPDSLKNRRKFRRRGKSRR